MAGLVVDVCLHPLDTIKVRMQAISGFHASGGYRNLYRGISATLIGSVPSGKSTVLIILGMLFFGLYSGASSLFGSCIIGALVGEIGSIVIRAPLDVLRQNKQINIDKESTERKNEFMKKDSYFSNRKEMTVSRHFLQSIRNLKMLPSRVVRPEVDLYKGFAVSVLRDLPFAFIQYPVYEVLKTWDIFIGMGFLGPAFSGMIAGSMAAVFTCPFDVVRTRIITGKEKMRIPIVFREVFINEGVGAFFYGIKQRIIWISLGGFLFLGSYDFCYSKLKSIKGHKMDLSL